MPPIRFSASKCRAYVVAVILLLNEIMLTYSHCVLKGLVYITIVAPLGRQSSSYTKCTKLNIRLSCDVRLVSNTKCVFFIHSYILQSLQLLYLIYLRVLYDSCCKKAQF